MEVTCPSFCTTRSERVYPIPLRNVHATILKLLGLDDDRLRYLHEGRLRQLTDIGGQVLTEVIA